MTFSLHLAEDGTIAKIVLQQPAGDAHKYTRGHVIVISGPALRTGASRLAAQAALAIGAGLVTIVGSRDALKEHAAHVTAIMLREMGSDLSYVDDRVRAIVAGPGAGVSSDVAHQVSELLAIRVPILLDADALTSFAEHPDRLFASLHAEAVLTPHHGEFARLFPDLATLERSSAARSAAERAKAVVLLKGPETVIASPDGRLAINRHASPWLATAGSGDILSGIIGGLLAQGQDAFEAAAIGAWIHGDIGLRFGPGLTADLMPKQIPVVLRGCLRN